MYLTENWRLKEQRYTLHGLRLNDEQVSFPPREVEPRSVEVYIFPQEAPQSQVAEPEAVLAKAV
jgi:hypothetical protein